MPIRSAFIASHDHQDVLEILQCHDTCKALQTCGHEDLLIAKVQV